jgi:flavin-dependent dehydrogenase
MAPIAQQTDVVVIGGGPAGSTSASFLARQGWDVTVFERAVFPRDHVGESMLPFCYWIFEELGVLDLMKDRVVRKPGVRFLDTDGETHTTFCFNQKIEGPSGLSFQVLRSEFDELLLDHSIEEGATVHEGVAVRKVDFDDDGRVHVTVEDPDGDTHEVVAKFVIDASGRDTFLANRMKTKTAHKELERTALSSHWTGCKYSGGLEQGMIQIVYTGGEKQGWIWVIPLARDRLSIGSVMNTPYFRARRKELKDAGVEDWQSALYLSEINDSAFVRETIGGAEQLWGIMYNGDYSYFCHQKYGDRFALVGDASAFIDPIFSSGVYLAMQSARYLADAVDARLRNGVDESEPKMKEVYEKIVGAYSLVDKLIRLFYTRDILNYAQLGRPEAAEAWGDFEHYQNTISLQHFLLGGDFFEQAHKYSEFIDTVKEPRKFKMYQKLVLERETFQADSSCEISFEDAFPIHLVAHEERRRAMGI